MVGGSEPDVAKAMPIFDALRPPTATLQTVLSTPAPPSVLVITRRWCTTASNTA